jgi:hypothetical protein
MADYSAKRHSLDSMGSLNLWCGDMSAVNLGKDERVLSSGLAGLPGADNSAHAAGNSRRYVVLQRLLNKRYIMQYHGSLYRVVVGRSS